MNEHSHKYIFVKNVFRLIRPHQYIKNLFLFLPLFFAGQLTDLELFINVCLSFVAFSATASGIYILNDLQDIENDRIHPQKKYRPLARGDISKKNALFLMGILFISGIFLMTNVSLPAFFILSIYIVLNIGYSFYLKHISILDVTIVAVGFVLRLFVGSEVSEIPLSKWIVLMTFLLALFIALAKRRDDVCLFLETGTKMREVTGNYNLKFTDGMMVVLASVVIVTYVLYTTSKEIIQRMQSDYLYLTALFVILGFMRYLQLAFVENDSSSPTMILLKDKFILLTVLAWVFTFTLIIYI